MLGHFWIGFCTGMVVGCLWMAGICLLLVRKLHNRQPTWEPPVAGENDD